MPDDLWLHTYVRDAPVDDIVRWLESVIGPLGAPVQAGIVTVYPRTGGNVCVTPGIEDGPFTQFYLPDGLSFWESDVACARECARRLGVVVRCDPPPELPGSDEGSPYLEIGPDGERVGQWELRTD